MGVTLDPFDYEVFYHRLFNLLCESRDVIRHISTSAIVREVGETAEGLCLPDGEVVLLSPGLLLHLNTVTRTIRYMLQNRFAEDVKFEDGDQFLCNDPMIASMHRMDMAMAAPFFYRGQHVAWIGNYTHVPEIGASEPGGHPMAATSCYYEGICLTPIKLVERGKIRRDLMETLTRVVRDPRPIELDTKAKISANERARENLTRLVDDFGLEFFQAACSKLLDDSELQSRTIVKTRRPGTYRARVFTDFNHPSNPRLRVMQLELEITDHGQLVLRTPVVSPQSPGCYNAPLPAFEGNVFSLTLSHLFYTTRWNGGVVRVYTTDVPYGSMLNCDASASVHYASVGTGMHAATALADIFARAAFAAGVPGDVIGPSGTVNQVNYGGIDQFGRPCGKYLMDCKATAGGGRWGKDGVDCGVSTVNPWAMCGDVEATEAEGPILQLGRRQMSDSGGFGRFRGGNTANSVILIHNTPRLVLGNMGQGKYVSILQGVFGGYPPSASRFVKVLDADVMQRAAHGEPLPHEIGDLFQYPAGRRIDAYVGAEYEPIRQGDLVGTIYWGGGGIGDPLERDPLAVARDLQDQATTLRVARDVYGVVVDPESGTVDEERTRDLREDRRRSRLRLGIRGLDYVRQMVERRQRRSLPKPALDLLDELAGVPWSQGFREALEAEEQLPLEAGDGEAPLGSGTEVLAITPYVRVVKDEAGRLWALCAACGHVYCRAHRNFKLSCLVYDRDPREVQGDLGPDPDWMVYREFYCPGCGTQVEVEATPPGMPILHTAEIADLLPA